MPGFSVIIPLFNKGKYISKAIESVLKQTFSDFELLVIDDGSMDDGLEKVKQFQDPRLIILEQKNAGVSLARNRAANEAKSEFLAFLDADDWWDENFLLEMKTLIHDFPDAKVYSSSYFKVKNKQNIPAKIGVESNFEKGYINYYKVYSNTFWVPVNCSFVVVKKDSFLSENGFNAKLKFGEDLDLWLRLSFKYKFAFINKNLAYSNQDVEIENRALGEKIWKKEEHVLFNLEYLAENEAENEELKFLLDGLRLRSFYIYFRKKVYLEEIKKQLKAIDFSKHDWSFKFYYTYPSWITKFYFNFKLFASRSKQFLTQKR